MAGVLRCTRAALVAAAGALLGACGGGSGAAGSEWKLEPTTGTEVPAGAAISRDWVLSDQGLRFAPSAHVDAIPDERLLQQPLICVGDGAEHCQPTAEGGLLIGPRPPGTAVHIRQVLRVAPGYQGVLANRLSVRHGEQAAAISVSETLVVRSFDLEVEVDALEYDGTDPTLPARAVTRLRNLGPSEARDIEWAQHASPTMHWLDTQCRASGQAQCPERAQERVSGLRLPVGGQLEFVSHYRYAGTSPSLRGGYVHAQAQALGDSRGENNRAHRVWGQPDALSQPARVLQLDGTMAELRSYWVDYFWRWIEDGRVTDQDTLIDPTGTFFFRRDDSWPRYWGAALRGNSGLLVGARLASGRSLVYLGSRHPIFDGLALEGHGFNVLMAQTDRSGRPLASRVWTAQIRHGQVELCAAEPPVNPSACPLPQLKRLHPAWVSGRLELMGAGERWTLDTAQQRTAPVLFGVGDADALGRRWTSVWVPHAAVPEDMTSEPHLLFSALCRSEGHELLRIEFHPDGGRLRPVRSDAVPNLVFMDYEMHGGINPPSGWLMPLAVPQLHKGSVDLGNFTPACSAGEVWLARGAGLSVLLGAQGGALQGQWAISWSN